MADEDGDAEVDEKDIIIVRWRRMLTERAPKVQIPGQQRDKDEDGKNVYTEKVLPPIQSAPIMSTGKDITYIIFKVITIIIILISYRL